MSAIAMKAPTLLDRAHAAYSRMQAEIDAADAAKVAETDAREKAAFKKLLAEKLGVSVELDQIGTTDRDMGDYTLVVTSATVDGLTFEVDERGRLMFVQSCPS